MHEYFFILQLPLAFAKNDEELRLFVESSLRTYSDSKEYLENHGKQIDINLFSFASRIIQMKGEDEVCDEVRYLFSSPTRQVVAKKPDLQPKKGMDGQGMGSALSVKEKEDAKDLLNWLLVSESMNKQIIEKGERE